MDARPYALVAPWPPQRNGIADYAFEIARATEGELLVVTAAAHPLPGAERHRIVRSRAFLDIPPSRRPAAIYHLGNNPDHAFLVPLFLRRPGAVVLHDLSLHYLAQCVDPLLPGFYAAQLAAEPPDVARLLTRLGPAGLTREMDHREIRLLSWLSAATALIVHSQAARRVVQAALPDVPVTVVPHFCYLAGLGLASLEQWRDAVRDPARARWMAGITFSGPAFVIAALGFTSADKQLGCVVRAIARLAEPARSQVVLLVAGQVRAGDEDLLELAARHGCSDRVRVLGWVDEADAELLLLAADLVMALRFPTRGESSGTLARALGLGCAAVVSDHGGYAELPDEAVIKLPARADVSEAVRALLVALIADRSRIVRTRHAGYAYAQRVGDPADMAARHARIARDER